MIERPNENEEDESPTNREHHMAQMAAHDALDEGEDEAAHRELDK